MVKIWHDEWAKELTLGEKQSRGEVCVKSTGIVRKVDELGRIVLPIELRRTLDIAEKDALEIYVDGSTIVLKKFRPSCVFCDSSRDLVTYKDKNICPRCLICSASRASVSSLCGP